MNTARHEIPAGVDDPINRQILTVSEDQVQGFHRDPFAEIARLSGIDQATVMERIRAMLAAGTIRRVRQTLLTNHLADGALVAWRVPDHLLDETFELMVRRDPFTGHVVIRSTDPRNPGADHRLWTTVKVPVGFSLERHCRFLARLAGAERFVIMPARGIFRLGVGHIRRENLEPGARSDQSAPMLEPEIVSLDAREWRALRALKREFHPDEIRPDPWDARAVEAGFDPAEFHALASDLARRGILARFSTFLEHAKPTGAGGRVTRFNALFHWAVPPDRIRAAGGEVGRHHILTHCYWRDSGTAFGGANIMAVAHGTDRARLLEHKAAIDAHLAEAGVPATYSSVFWGERSEVRPSELFPDAYRDWARAIGMPDA